MAALEIKNVVPDIADGRFAFTILAPADWQQPPVPEDNPDFSTPHAMKGLAIFVSNNPSVPILLTVSGRPGYDDGAIMQWATFIVENQGLTLKTCMPVRLESHEAIEITATQEADPEIGEMTIKGVFLEDGGNFFIVTTMAPTKLFDDLEPDFEKMRNSFALEHAQGATKPLVEGAPVPRKIEKPQPKKSAEKPVVPPLEKTVASAVSDAAPANAAPATGAQNTGPDFTKFVLDDPTALSDEDEINARFRDTGNGLVVRVQQINPDRGYAVVGSGALAALFAVPLGWHVVDDGRRTLIFDRHNVGQVNLTYISIEGQSPDDIFTAIIQDLSKESPNVEHKVLDLEGNPGLAVRNLIIDGEQLMQCYILVRHPFNENCAVKVRVTSDEKNIGRILDMAGEIVKYVQYMK